MPVLDNIKWERFCQNIVKGVNEQGKKFTQGAAYQASGYNSKDVGKRGGSAEVNASKLLNHSKIENRIAELLREAQDKSTTKHAVTIDSITQEYNEAREFAKKLDNPSAFLAASQAKAKLHKLEVNVTENINTEANVPSNSDEIALALLADVGLTDPDEETKQRALEAYDTMIAKLEAIRDEKLGLKPYQN